MKPNVNINFNEVFENSKFLEELKTVVIGAELALMYLKVPDAQIKEIQNRIVRSAFNSFTLDYDAMSAAAQHPKAAVPLPQSPPNPPADTALYSGAPGIFNTEEPDYNNYYPNLTAQSALHDSPNASEAFGTSALSFQPAASNEFNAVNSDDIEQTVVYENYADISQTMGKSHELSSGYGKNPEALWESESRKDENTGLGKIRWTTYPSAASHGDEPQKAMSDQQDAYLKTEDPFVSAK